MAMPGVSPRGRSRCRRCRVGSCQASTRRVRAAARSFCVRSGDRQADQVLDERSDVDPRRPAGGRLAGSRRKAPPGARGTGARVRLIRAASGPSFSRAPGPTERTRRPPPASRQSRGVRLQRRDLPRPAVLGPQVPERRAGACAARQLRRRGRSSELSVRLQQDRRPAVASDDRHLGGLGACSGLGLGRLARIQRMQERRGARSIRPLADALGSDEPPRPGPQAVDPRPRMGLRDELQG
jgi:hypothetical protein